MDRKQFSSKDLEITKLKRSLQHAFVAKATDHVPTASTGMLPTVLLALLGTGETLLSTSGVLYPISDFLGQKGMS